VATGRSNRPTPARPSFRDAFALPLLRGCGQMLFQPSALTGGVFLALILTQSAAAFSMCLAGALGATLCAFFVEYPRRVYFDGLGGFNGGLLGLALALFYELSATLLVVGFAGGVLTGFARAGLERILPMPPFTAPFVGVAWLAFGMIELLALDPATLPAPDGSRLYALATNASQVLFLLNPWVGLMVIVAVLLHSRSAALWVAGASMVAWLTTLVLGLPDDLAAAGLLGYNALILAAALQHRGTFVPLAVAGVVASVWLTYVCFQFHFTPLSAPFVASAWLVIGMEWLARRTAKTPT